MASFKEKFQTVAQITMIIKDTQLAVLFMEMFKLEWFIAFNASPAAFVVKPILGLALLLLGIMQLIRMFTEKNKTPDMWIMTILGITSILLSNISIFGGITAKLLGVAFKAAPLYFLASLVVGCFMQLLLMGYHCYAASQAKENSVERMHHLQAIVQCGILAAQFAVCSLAVALAVMFPISAPVTAALSVLAVSSLVSVIVWRLIPHSYKLAIKGYLGFGKPSLPSLGERTPLLVNVDSADLAVMATDIEADRETTHSAGLSIFSEESSTQPIPTPLSPSLECYS